MIRTILLVPLLLVPLLLVALDLAEAQERDIGPRLKAVIIKPAEAATAPQPRPRPPDPPPEAQLPPPQPQPLPPTVISPIVQLHPVPQSDSWVSWILTAIAGIFTSLYGMRSYLDRAPRPRQIATDPQFAATIHAAVLEVVEQRLQQRVEQQRSPGRISHRGENQ